MPRLNSQQRHLLVAIHAGDTLKVHRTVDGEKVYRLHPLDGSPEQEIVPADAERLLAQGYIVSNMKFPAAVFLITPEGARAVAKLLQ